MVEVSPELIQMLGLFAGLGAVYGGIRADLKRLHLQAERHAVTLRKTRRKLAGHIRREDATFSNLMASVKREGGPHCRRVGDRVG